MENLITYRHNILEINSPSSFARIHGGMHGNVRDVYFVRLLGADAASIKEFLEMDDVLSSRMQEGKVLYKRLQNLPRLADAKETAYYTSCYENWHAQTPHGIQRSGSPKYTAGINTKASQANPQLASQLASAWETAVGYYVAGRAATSSIQKNFGVKLLYWFDYVFSNIAGRWDACASIKIAADNVEKEQEYLFYYMLTLVGCDVLLLQSRQDVTAGGQAKKLSKAVRIGTFSTEPVPAYQPKAPAGATNASRTGAAQARPYIDPPNRQAANSQTLPATNTSQPQTPAADLQMPRPSAACFLPQNGTRQAARKEKSFEELALLASSIVLINVHDGSGEVVSTGSGIMVGKNGYILTNCHVAAGGYSYTVRIENDSQEYHTDELVKYHPILDLAILRIPRQLQPLPIYQGAQKLARGQAVAAIGSPLGLFNSISNGIISGFRKVDGVDMIQFTAPISHGSSGGAVLNMYGEVIGISTAGFDRGQNINLAVGYEKINLFIRGFA